MAKQHPPVFRIALLFVVLLSSAVPAAQAEVIIRTRAIGNRALFGIEFPEGQSLYGLASMVYAVSLQKYQTGPFMVTEMVVDIAGVNSQYRIYATEPLSTSDMQARLPEGTPDGFKTSKGVPPAVQRLMDKNAETTSTTMGALVVKDYPLSTHAKTIEYRLANPEDVVELYEAFSDLYKRKVRTAIVQGSVESQQEQEEDVNKLGGTLFTFK